MPKSKSKSASKPATSTAPATNPDSNHKPFVATKSLDPVLTSLFASSSGPVQIVPKPVQQIKTTSDKPALSESDRTSSEQGDGLDVDDSQNSELSDQPEAISLKTRYQPESSTTEPPRKRRKVANGDSQDLENAYFKRLELEEEKELKQRELERTGPQTLSNPAHANEDATSSSGDDESEEDDVPSETELDRPVHESLARVSTDADKLKRTVFLGNVSTEAIKSSAARRSLIKHLRSAIKSSKDADTGKQTPAKLESLRFRSTAYASSSGPKKATFAKKELLDATTRSTNAYAVFTTPLVAQSAAKKLNGTIVLDRHLRADWLGSSTEQNHRRCVFIGNLSFVDEESSEQTATTNPDGTPRRPKAKEPADPEEGLWRTFGKIGTVESVRVIRDQETRISKGFAYVQFTDENSVEKALLLNEKKFPPMLPRKLRVMRAKKTKSKAPSENFGIKNRDKKPGRGKRDTQISRKQSVRRTHAGDLGPARGGVVFEGHRATSQKGKGKPDKSSKRNSKRPNTRSSRRGAAFKAAGGGKFKSDNKG